MQNIQGILYVLSITTSRNGVNNIANLTRQTSTQVLFT